jgi:hypothetical protein
MDNIANPDLNARLSDAKAANEVEATATSPTTMPTDPADYLLLGMPLPSPIRVFIRHVGWPCISKRRGALTRDRHLLEETPSAKAAALKHLSTARCAAAQPEFPGSSTGSPTPSCATSSWGSAQHIRAGGCCRCSLAMFGKTLIYALSSSSLQTANVMRPRRAYMAWKQR